MPMQIRRTATPNLPPTGLAEGQLGVEMAGTRPRLWIGVPTAVDPSGRRLLVPSGASSSATAPANPVTGDLWYNPGNDILNFYDGTNWVPVPMGDPQDGVLYGRRDGLWSAIPLPEIPDYQSIVPLGGRLGIVGSSPANNIRFSMFNGNWIRINGNEYPIPMTGLTSSVSNVVIDGVAGQTLTDQTMYYVYLFDAAGTLRMEFSTVGHQTSTTLANAGTEIKQSDDTRSFIGIVEPRTGQFLDEDAFRLVRSWFNRPQLVFYRNIIPYTAGVGVWWTGAGQSAVLTFAGESIFTVFTGYAVITNAGLIQFGVTVNSITPPVTQVALSTGAGAFPFTAADVRTATNDGRNFFGGTVLTAVGGTQVLGDVQGIVGS